LKLDRRTLLIGGGAGVGLIVGFALWPHHWASELTVGKGEETFGSYIKIARDGRITVAVPQVETGQGAWTALPQIVADGEGLRQFNGQGGGLARGNSHNRQLDLGARL
jgi:isoquinoline 1-oxidoreductase beta subunit